MIEVTSAPVMSTVVYVPPKIKVSNFVEVDVTFTCSAAVTPVCVLAAAIKCTDVAAGNIVSIAIVKLDVYLPGSTEGNTTVCALSKDEFAAYFHFGKSTDVSLSAVIFPAAYTGATKVAALIVKASGELSAVPSALVVFVNEDKSTEPVLSISIVISPS